MYGFCTIQDVRNKDSKFEDLNEFSDSFLETQIGEAEYDVIIDLSDFLTEPELINMIGNKVLRSLSIYKAIINILVNKFSITREAELDTDIKYWKTEYESLLKKIFDGDIKIVVAGDIVTPSAVPKITGGVTRIFQDRELQGFLPDEL